MKATGVIRKLDQLGRIVFPIELRRTLELEEGTPVEIFTEGKNIILKKYEPGCHCCGNHKNLTKVMDMDLCPTCLGKFKTAIKVLENKGLIKK
jgi:transcriptional pleiotropic regulator of transition state genes